METTRLFGRGIANIAMIVRATVDLGRNLGLRVVAEGVETEEQMADGFRKRNVRTILDQATIPLVVGVGATLVGATLVDDVTAFEHLKMRVLNGAQSSLSYLGVLAGLEHTFDDIADPLAARLVEGRGRAIAARMVACIS